MTYRDYYHTRLDKNGKHENWRDQDFSVLNGETLTAIKGAHRGSATVHLSTESGKEFLLYHSQCCCEAVEVEDVCGDIDDLIGSPILLAEEVSNSDPIDGQEADITDSFTWTFYKLATIKGSVTIRWYGESNGYYSEDVDFLEAQGSKED